MRDKDRGSMGVIMTRRDLVLFFAVGGFAGFLFKRFLYVEKPVKARFWRSTDET